LFVLFALLENVSGKQQEQQQQSDLLSPVVQVELTAYNELKWLWEHKE